MSERLRELRVLVLDCQASGATPAHGDLLEIGWAVCGAGGIALPVRSRFIAPRTKRPIGRAVRELTGWSEACLADAVDEELAWNELEGVLGAMPSGAERPVPTAIHFARFELAFLRDLHERRRPGRAFPFDVVCLHAIASRLFPDLPRKNIRALAGYLGHSPELLRRSAGHVEATAFIWRALVPRLEEAGVQSWDELSTFLAAPAPVKRSSRRSFPLAVERRRALPDASGVYRFVRKNGDVIYVGKAASLKKRVASHFKSRGPATERGLELLTQVDDIVHTQTPSILEAALLECDEIKRLDPPYNVQLRAGERSAWFAGQALDDTVPAPDDSHRLGPLPSARALASLAALTRLVDGAEPSPALRAMALAVPSAFVPDAGLFLEGFRTFVAEHVAGDRAPARERLLSASLELWLRRGRTEPDASPEDRAPDEWDLARVRRRLERNFVQAGLLVRRADALCLLVDASIAFRESAKSDVRGLVVFEGRIIERRELGSVLEVGSLGKQRPRSLYARQRSFDSAVYDRLRTLLTELLRIRDEGGEIAIGLGAHIYGGARLFETMRAV